MEQKVNGNITGIRATMLEQLRALYDFSQGQDVFADAELLYALAALSEEINREISVYIKRNGDIVDVSIGDSSHVSMPDMRVVRNEDRLNGVRCIHTHPGGSARLSEVDLGTLRLMRLDCMAAIGIKDGKPTALYAAYLGEWGDAGFETLIYGPMRPDRLPQRALMSEIYAADERLKSTTVETAAIRPERAILVGIEQNLGYDAMEELAQLAATAGAEVVGQSIQRKRSVDKATYVGSGKVEELALLGSALEADIFLFDDELTGMQLRNLEEQLGRKVIDRMTLILDIFAARAQTREGSLQVELAQLKCRLSRSTGSGLALSRMGAGIGTRGPGEKKLEIDRRRIRRRIYELEQGILEIKKQRAVRRNRREQNAVPLVALVGYTNAGKSTLLNTVTGSDVLAADMLFATLDPVVRQVRLPNGTEALFSDTVGFINKLPHDLVNAFHATLEEITYADLILHVIDSANPHYEVQMQVVEGVLEELSAINTPRINVFNQIDRPGATPAPRDGDACISAKTGEGVKELLALVEKALLKEQVELDIVIPYARYEALSLLRANGRILQEEHREDGVHIRASVEEKALWKVKAAIAEK